MRNTNIHDPLKDQSLKPQVTAAGAASGTTPCVRAATLSWQNISPKVRHPASPWVGLPAAVSVCDSPARCVLGVCFFIVIIPGIELKTGLLFFLQQRRHHIFCVFGCFGLGVIIVYPDSRRENRNIIRYVADLVFVLFWVVSHYASVVRMRSDRYFVRAIYTRYLVRGSLSWVASGYSRFFQAREVRRKHQYGPITS